MLYKKKIIYYNPDNKILKNAEGPESCFSRTAEKKSMRGKFKMNDISGGAMVKCLMQSQLFSGVGETGLVNFSKIAKFREVKTGEIVFSEGEKAEGFYIVAEGVVKIYKLSAAGKSRAATSRSRG